MTSEDQIISLWRSGYDTQEIADKLGILEFYVHAKTREERESRISKVSMPVQGLSCRKVFDPCAGIWRYRTPLEITRLKAIQGGRNAANSQANR